MEYHAILRDLPDQLARTGIQLRRDQHGLQQLMTPRVEYDPPPKIGCKRTQNLPDRVPPLSDTDSFESSEEDTIAALSGSCSSLRRRGSSSNVPPSAGSVPAPIPVDSPRPKSRLPPLSSESAPPSKHQVVKVDIFGEASSDSDGSVSMTGSPRYAENAVLPPAEYDRSAPTRVPRAE